MTHKGIFIVIIDKLLWIYYVCYTRIFETFESHDMEIFIDFIFLD